MWQTLLDFRRSSVYALCFLLVLDLIQTFSVWKNESFVTLDAITKNIAVCPPYFQNCLSYYFLDTVPISYGQNILYMVLGGLVFLALYFLYQRKYDLFVLALSFPLLYKFLYVYFLTYLPTGNYTVFGLFFGLLLLFSAYKVVYLRILVVVFYLCAAIIKLHDGYLSGDVFSSLSLGAPLVPAFLLPYTGIAFLVFCVIAPLGLLLSKKALHRNIFLWTLTAFHLYSISMVGFRYPLLLIPILWVLFHYEKEPFYFKKEYLRDFFSVAIIGSMVLLQLIPFFIKGDERLTGEGYRYGYYMYDGNHQCESKKIVYFKDGTTKEMLWENKKAMYSCDPYEEWFKIQRWCNPEKVASISWTYDHSLNGEKYRRIVDEKNACGLVYKPFIHNTWIQERGILLDKEVIKNSI